MIHQLPPLKPLASTFPRRDSLPSGRDDGHGKKNECIASVVLYDQCRQVSHDGQLNSDQLKWFSKQGQEGGGEKEEEEGGSRRE